MDQKFETEANKRAAVEFLQGIAAGRIDEAFSRHVDMAGRHHNAYSAAGFAGLRDGMKGNHAAFPDKKLTIKSVIAENDRVVVHSHLILTPGELELVTVHIFRFEGGKIAELWDVPLPIPADSPNEDGLF